MGKMPGLQRGTMKSTDLQYQTFSKEHLKYYSHRAADFSGQFLRWFLEHIFRLDPQDADDSAVDAKHDKGIDAIYVDDVSETIYVLQAKTQTKDKATLGDGPQVFRWYASSIRDP